MQETPAALRRRHKVALQPLDRYQTRLLRLIRATVEALEENEGSSWNTPTIPNAFGLLAQKSISHAESIRLLTGAGRYGDSYVILRSLISDALMCRFLMEYEDRIPEWVNYAAQRPAATKQERIKLERRFSDKAVRKGLEAKGLAMPGVEKSFAMYSEPSHASYWGLLFYARRESKSKFTMLPHGHFDNFTANTLAIQTILYLDALLLHAIYLWLQRTDKQWAKRLLRRYLRLTTELRVLYDVHAEYLDEAFSKMAD